MEDLSKRAIASLEALSNLKRAGILNNVTSKLLIDAHLSSKPSEKYDMLNNAILFSKMFSSAFDKPDESVKATINIAVSENNIPIGIYPEDCHILIAGQTGTGKSTLVKLIFTQAMNLGCKIWLFVRSKENRSLIEFNRDILVCNFNESIKYNPLNPCGTPFHDYCNRFVDIYAQSNTVYDGTKNYILEILNPLYLKYSEHNAYPSIHDLYLKIKSQKHPPTSRTIHYQESALNRLNGMISGPLGKVFDCSIGHESAFFNNNCIFEIDNLTTEQQRFIVNLLLMNLFYHRLEYYPDQWMFVGIDDANLIFDSSLEKRSDLGLPIIHHLLTTVRKSKINLFVCTQTPHQIGASIHSNSFAKIMFSLSNGKDIDSMQHSMGIKDQEQKSCCYKLKQREAVIKFSTRYQEPFLARIPEVTL